MSIFRVLRVEPDKVGFQGNLIPWNPESWFFSYAIPNPELLPKACLAASPTPHSPEKTAQRNLFHLRRKTGRCLVLSVWIDVCVSVSLVIFDNTLITRPSAGTRSPSPSTTRSP